MIMKKFNTILLISVIILIVFVIWFIYLPNTIFTPVNNDVVVEPIPIPQVVSLALQKIIDGQSLNNFAPKPSMIGLPMRLKIEVINVDTTVEHLGLTKNGEMDVPKVPNDVSWFNLGPRPGEMGSAVIAGHYGWKNNIPAVFDDLHKLKIGDQISIVDSTGLESVFVVREIGLYDQKENAVNVFSSNDGKAHLNLITCEGAWNVSSKSRPNRLVIFTDKVD
ncbi:MAG: class F sortase [bacterium]